MGSAHRRVTRCRAPLLLLLFALLALLVAAPGVWAGPPDPTMSLDELRTELEAGPLDGHLLTTMKGTTPERITVQVQSVIDYSDGSLILFEASGPWIDRIGGIASGMSGSPVYVDDGGVDKLVGALSYGDMFTLNGLGLATPIEFMTAIQDTYPLSALRAVERARPPAAGVYKLSEPARTSHGVVTSVRVARSARAAAKVEAPARQSVMAPLGLLEIGGVRPGSAAFDRIAARFARSGFLVKAAPGTSAWAGPPTPDLEPGSPCAILFSQGSVWVGAAGTVTYVDGDAVMIFGHPFAQFGPLEADLTGGFVQGVWGSSLAPYKLIAPRDVKGAVVQDRMWGVEGDLGKTAPSFPVTTELTLPGVATPFQDQTDVSQWLFTGGAYPDLPGGIVSTLALRWLDQTSYPGSGETTTVIRVSDDTGTYTVSRHNIWTDPFDVSWLLGMDASDLLYTLSSNPDGVLQPEIESVAVTGSLSPTQRSARIAAITLPDGWGPGENVVRVDYYRYGSPAVQSLETTLTVPAGTSLYGRLAVYPAVYGGGEDEEVGSSPASDPPATLAELVDQLNASPGNGELIVSYQPEEGIGPGAPDPIERTVATGYVFSNELSLPTAYVTLRARPRTVAYGADVTVTGSVESSKDVAVTLYRRDAGGSEVEVATLHARSKQGMASFTGVVRNLRRNTTLIARVGSVDGSLPGGAVANVKVTPRVWLTGAARLAVHVRPATDDTVMLQRRARGVWKNYKRITVLDGEGSTRLPKGTHVLRVKVPAGELHAAGTSPVFTIKVK